MSPRDECLSELSGLLSESVDDARLRESTAFDRFAGELSSRIVLFGAGGLGRRTLSGLDRAGIRPLAFADNNSALWGTDIGGITVLSPEDAALRYANSAVFVISIWGADSLHRYQHSFEQLRQLGCDRISPIAWLAWRYPTLLLPHYALDLPSKLIADKGAVEESLKLFRDLDSCREYVSQIRWRLSGDPGCLSGPVQEAQYLVSDIARALDNEVVIDCGAYDGDTLRSWLEVRGATFATYFAMEPDPDSRSRLETNLRALPSDVAERIRVLPYATSNLTGPMSFSASGLPSASLGSAGDLTVEGIRIDDLQSEFEQARPTFIKMDIEGAELDAIEGAANTIRTFQPMLAIAAYHSQNHIWRIPLAVAALSPNNSFYLRPHNEEAWDTIFYSVPSGRAL